MHEPRFRTLLMHCVGRLVCLEMDVTANLILLPVCEEGMRAAFLLSLVVRTCWLVMGVTVATLMHRMHGSHLNFAS